MTVMMGLWWRASNDSPYHPPEAPVFVKSCLLPVVVLVPDSRHLAGGDAGVFHHARWWRLHRKTRAPTTAPNSNAQRRPLFGKLARKRGTHFT
jgi:hypothetical protein